MWRDRERRGGPGTVLTEQILATETVKSRAIRVRRRRRAVWPAVWIAAIACLALLHAWHLRADFPNGSPWTSDGAKYTDEGWYGNAAIRAHLFGNWYVAGDFNPAVAVPAWPFLEWLLFFSTGVTIAAARGLAVACFFLNLVLSYLLLRGPGSGGPDPASGAESRGPRWMALLGVTLAVTSPFLYCFSRLAILEPLETTLILAAMNLAVRLGNLRRPVQASAWIGFLFALAVLTKTTGLFLLPALLWAVVVALWDERRVAWRCALATTGVAGLVYGAWMAVVAAAGLVGDLKYYFFINTYRKPPEFGWQLVAFWWSFHGLLWVDRGLIAIAGAVVLAAALGWRSAWGRELWRNPLFGASLWAVAGCVLFMTMQNHPQPRYYVVPAYFCFFVVALGAAALLGEPRKSGQPGQRGQPVWVRGMGWAVAIAAIAAAAVDGAETMRYAAHPQYTWANAATELATYMDAHPNGKRLLTSISGDQITLFTHVPSLCDDFSQPNLPSKLKRYQPGWYATWNVLDPSSLNDLHALYSLEQVASFQALDDPDRNFLVLFKLHPLPGGEVRSDGDENLRIALPGDQIAIPIE